MSSAVSYKWLTAIKDKKASYVLIAIFFLALVLNIYNNNFRLGYHFDEPIKTFFIKTNTQNFHHPVLMLHTVRIANWFTGFTVDQNIVILGRTINAIFGALTAVLAYFISRPVLKENGIYVAALCATSPILVIHSHYLKEDIVLTFFCLLSLLLLYRYIKNKDSISMIGLGISIGLAISSHYKGILLLIVCAASAILFPLNDKRNYFKGLLISFVISMIVFIIINYPMFSDPDIFWKGISHDLDHIVGGHSIKIHTPPELFGFHLVNSIIPGMTAPVTMFALFFLLYTVLTWKKAFWYDRILIFYVLVFYFTVEISPTKPFPGFMRYVIPIVPILLYFAWRGVAILFSWSKTNKARILLASFVTLFCLWPLYESLQLVYHLNRDTREIAERLIKDRRVKAKFETYAAPSIDLSSLTGLNIPVERSQGITQDVRSLTSLNIPVERSQGITHLVASSFMYDRFIYGNRLKDQDPSVYDTYRKYEELFSYPFLEIRPAYRSFAFSNPTIRIIDIRVPK